MEVADPHGDGEESSPEPIEALVDLLLSLLVKPSAFVRDCVTRDDDDADEDVWSDGDEDSDSEEDADGAGDASEAGKGSDGKAKLKATPTGKGKSSKSISLLPVGDMQAIMGGQDMLDVSGDVGGDSDSDDDLDLDDMDDEAMALFDRLAEALLKEKKQARAATKEMAKQMFHFRNKVVELITVFIKQQGQSSLLGVTASPALLHFFVPLLRTILTIAPKSVTVGSARTERMQLYANLKAMYLNRLCKIKDFPVVGSAADAESFKASFTELMSLASKRRDGAAKSETEEGGGSETATLSMQAIIFMTKVAVSNSRYFSGDKKSAAASAADPLLREFVVEEYKTALGAFMVDRSSRLSPKTFKELCNRYPVVGWQLLADVCKWTKDAR
jgi:DNA polymerase phi